MREVVGRFAMDMDDANTPVDEAATMTNSFHGMEPKALTFDRLYRIVVSPEALVGAYIGGQFADLDPHRVADVGITIAIWWQRRRRRAREAMYATLDPFEAKFMAADRRNFRIARSDIRRAVVDRRRSRWRSSNSAAIEIELFNRTRRKFILIGEQDPERVVTLLRTICPTTEAIGNAAPRRVRTPLTPRQKRRRRVTLGVMLLGMGAFFGAAAATAPSAPPNLVVLAVINAAVGVWVVAKALRRPVSSTAVSSTSSSTDDE